MAKTMSIYRRRSSAFAGGFGYQNRRASNIVIPKGLESYQNNYTGDDDFDGQYIKECIEAHEKSRKRDWDRILVTSVLCYGNFCVGSAYSVLGPLFPKEGKSKNISEAWIGIIMSQYEVAIFFGSILFGKLIPYMNPKHSLIAGLLIAGISSLLFGFLYLSSPGLIFIAIALLIRTVEGMGAALFFISAWTIVGVKYPEHLARIFAMTEMFYAIGMIFGPGIGGLLEELGQYLKMSFIIPFEVLGALILLGGVVAYFLIKPMEKQDECSEKTSILSIVKNFNFSINLLITINGMILIGFNDATLSLHLKTIQKLSPGFEGAIFVVQGAFYAMFNPYWGSLVDKVANPHSLCLAGCFFSMINYIISGPLPFIPIEPNLWLVIVGQIFLGFSMGGLIVGSFTHGFQEVLKSGFQENVSTYAVISASFSSAFALGSAIGPAIGGYLLGQLGYRWATFPIVGLELIFIAGIIGFNLINDFNSDEVKPENNTKTDDRSIRTIDEYIEMC